MISQEARPDRGTARVAPPVAPPVAGRSPGRTRRIVARVAAWVLGLLLLVALVRILSPSSAFNVDPATTGQWRAIPVVALLLLLAGSLVLLSARPARARLRGLLHRLGPRAWWIFVAVTFAAQLVLAHAVLQVPDWDATQILEMAYHLAVAPKPRLFSVGDQSAYFSLYPNNGFLVAAFAVLFGALKACGLTGLDQYVWATVVVNCVALTGTLVLIRFIAGRLAPGAGTAVAAGLGVLLVTLSPWLNVAYSDTLAMVFPVGMLAVWLAWPPRRSLVSSAGLFAVLGVLCGIGVAIKPTVLFMGGALLLVTALVRTPAGRWDVRRAATCLVGLGAAFLVAHGGIGWAVQALFPGYGGADAMPFTHFMAMGSTGDGGFNAADFDSSWTTPAQERSSVSLHLWEARVEAMGPLGYPLFLAQKMLYALSDGTFFQDREGVGSYDTSYFSHDPFSAAVQAVFPLGSPLHWTIASVWQAAWWGAILLCFVPLRRLRLPLGAPVLAMRIALLLLLAFLCLSESRSRYLYHYLPVVLVLAALGAEALTAELAALRDRWRHRLRGVESAGQPAT